MNHLISIIIPIYNAEEYLEKCINSIIQQTYSNWELILINDGSIDKSETICKKYSNQYNNIYYYYKINEGVSIARNFGITKAKGKWIIFIDSDDYIKEDYLYQFITDNDNDYDMIVGGYNVFGISKENIKPASSKVITIEYQNFSFIDVQENNPNINILYHICGKLYNKKIIDEYKISFSKKMKLAEDTCFNIDYISHINNIKIIPYAGYYYRKNNIEKKRTIDYSTYITHLSLFEKSINNLLERKGYKLINIYYSINRAFFEALNEYLYLYVNQREFINVAKKISNCNIKFHQIYPKKQAKGIIYKICYNYPHIGFYMLRFLLKFKRIILK